MMTEQNRILVVIDKDGTLTEPASGATFPQTPTDQQLMPGVAEALELLRGDRYSLAIASNQGGCDVFTVQASRVQVGNYIIHRLDDPYRVEGIAERGDGIYFQYDRERPNRKDYSFAFPESEIKVSYKTIKSAIEEVQYAADLTEIEYAAFCPVMSGLNAVIMRLQNSDHSWHIDRINGHGSWLFRKPQPGMLLSLAGSIQWKRQESEAPFTHCVMIGDRPEDKAAADAAGFVFLDAAEWRSGMTVDQAIERSGDDSVRVIIKRLPDCHEVSAILERFDETGNGTMQFNAAGETLGIAINNLTSFMKSSLHEFLSVELSFDGIESEVAAKELFQGDSVRIAGEWRKIDAINFPNPGIVEAWVEGSEQPRLLDSETIVEVLLC